MFLLVVPYFWSYLLSNWHSLHLCSMSFTCWLESVFCFLNVVEYTGVNVRFCCFFCAFFSWTRICGLGGSRIIDIQRCQYVTKSFGQLISFFVDDGLEVSVTTKFVKVFGIQFSKLVWTFFVGNKLQLERIKSILRKEVGNIGPR